MGRWRIYIKCCLLLRRPCTEILDETRNRWADVVFALNVVFYSGGRVLRFLIKTRTRWTDVVFALNVVFYSGGRVRRGSLDEDKEHIYIKCRLLLRRPCTEVLDETRNRWANVVFTLNVVFY